ncbi:MAG: hypothetical protein V3T27_00135 [Alphaproteobacteria bacterium]
MAIFYRGAGVGTYWHENDARGSGFTPKNSGIQPSNNRLMLHIARMVVDSPYISLTLSYGVAHSYAVFFGRVRPKKGKPAYVYDLEISKPTPSGLQLLDPIKKVAREAPAPPAEITYQHDGDIQFLLGVVEPRMRAFLDRPVRQPPPGTGGTKRTPNLSIQLETLVRALRDAEILAVGNIPAICVRNRHEVW